MTATLPPPGARLMIILAAGAPVRAGDVLPLLEKGDVAAVLWRGAPEAEAVAAVQQRDVAALLAGAPQAAAADGLDGVHVTGSEQLKPALSALKPAGIVGVGGLTNRHEAMLAGESGADYVLFGALDGDPRDFSRALDLVSWWADLFEVPCVGVAGTLDEVEALAHAGADFIALSGPLVAGPDAPVRVAEAQARLTAANGAGAAP